MIKVFTVLAGVLLFIQPSLHAHPFVWAGGASGTGAIAGKSIAIDHDNNSYVCGVLNGKASFGTMSVSGKGSFVLKSDNNGTPIWVMALQGITCTTVATGGQPTISIAGYFYDTVLLGGNKLASSGNADYFVASISSSGNILWARKGGGPGNDYAYGAAVDANGNTYIAGSFEDYINFDSVNNALSAGKSDAFIGAYSNTGTFLWFGAGGGPGADAGTAVAVDLYGNSYLAGYYEGTASFYNFNITAAGGKDIFLAEFNPQGYPLPLHSYGGAGDDIPAAMCLDGSANLYLTGTFTGTAHFDNKTITSTGKDVFTAAFTNKGTINWLNQIGGSGNSAGLAIVSDWQSNVFVTGVFAGTANIGPASLTSSGSTDIYLVKYDALGRVLWATSAGGALADTAFGIGVDQNDQPYITGSVRGTAGFGSLTYVADSTGAFFLAQMAISTTGIVTLTGTAQDIRVFPNPSAGVFIFELNEHEPPPNMYVTDIEGRIIAHATTVSASSIIIDLRTHPEGIYLLAILEKNVCHTVKLIKEQ